MAKLNRECTICGKAYRYCDRCSEDRGKPLWLVAYCGENCKAIYDICVDYRDKKTTAEQANAALKKIDLSYIDRIEEGAKNFIKEIQSSSKKKGEAKKA